MKNLIRQYIPEVDDMRLIRILASEDTAAQVLNDRRCLPDSFLVYSIDAQVDCVWLTPSAEEWIADYGMDILPETLAELDFPFAKGLAHA